jgi:hypothetical protein
MATAPPIPDLADCSADDLRKLVIRLLEANAKLEAAVAALTEENARLKGLKGRPQIKPSGMEKGTDPGAGVAPDADATRKKRRQRQRKRGQPKSARLIVDNDHVVPFTPEPAWRFKGYKPYTVQDLVIEVRTTRYWRPFYLTPEGKFVVAPLPKEVRGHFGANLLRYLLSQHYQCRVTMPLLRQQLEDFGMLISAGQISNLLTKDHDGFHAEKAAVKQAGLETARWISVDDTTARHLGCNGIITQIGDDRFTSFDTVDYKNRLMFLMTLRGDFADYVINDAALVYLHEQDASAALIDLLMVHEGKVFADEDAWTDHLIAIGITATKTVRLASEAAVAGFADLDDALARLKERKAELLVVLDRPEVPLNTNSSEQEIRDPVTLRKISGGTRSEDGRRCRDTFLSLKKTCQKNAISFWAYLGDRLGIAANTVARLPDLIRRRAVPAAPA